MATAVGGHPKGFAASTRSDAWWMGPLLTALGLGAFFAYGTIRAFEGAYYFSAPYLSPFFSPLLFVDSGVAGSAPIEHAWFGGSRSMNVGDPNVVVVPSACRHDVQVFRSRMAE